MTIWLIEHEEKMGEHGLYDVFLYSEKKKKAISECEVRIAADLRPAKIPEGLLKKGFHKEKDCSWKARKTKITEKEFDIMCEKIKQNNKTVADTSRLVRNMFARSGHLDSVDKQIKKVMKTKAYNKLRKNWDIYFNLLYSILMPGMVSMDFGEVKSMLKKAEDLKFSGKPPKNCKGAIIMFEVYDWTTLDEINEKAEKIMEKFDKNADYVWSVHVNRVEGMEVIWVM